MKFFAILVLFAFITSSSTSLLTDSQDKSIGSKDHALIPINGSEGFKLVSKGGDKGRKSRKILYVHPIENTQHVITSIDFNLCEEDFNQTTILINLYVPKRNRKIRPDELLPKFKALFDEPLIVQAKPGWNSVDLLDHAIGFPSKGFYLLLYYSQEYDEHSKTFVSEEKDLFNPRLRVYQGEVEGLTPAIFVDDKQNLSNPLIGFHDYATNQTPAVVISYKSRI